VTDGCLRARKSGRFESTERHMKSKALLLSAAAAVVSLGLGQFYLKRLEAEVSGGPKIPVLVAAQDLPAGELLSESSLALRDVPLAYLEARQVKASELKKVLGTRLAAGLKVSESLQWSDLGKFSDRSRVLSGLVQQGQRAVAIDGRSADFQGLLRPGDRVDVLLTTSGKDAASTTITLVQNLLVLSVGGNIARADEENAKGFSRGGGATVSATLAQAQVLTQAQQQGRLTLVLRNSDDVAVVDGTVETNNAHLVPQSAREKAARSAGPKEVIEHVR
jgi:pilus assembly protein CpaB